VQISRTLLDKPAAPHKAKSFHTRCAAIKRKRFSTRSAVLKNTAGQASSATQSQELSHALS
jgi:hypothetical protein